MDTNVQLVEKLDQLTRSVDKLNKNLAIVANALSRMATAQEEALVYQQDAEKRMLADK
jgi:hypothetical protein